MEMGTTSQELRFKAASRLLRAVTTFRECVLSCLPAATRAFNGSYSNVSARSFSCPGRLRVVAWTERNGLWPKRNTEK